MLPEHLKCNILKAQMEAVFRVSTKLQPDHLSQSVLSSVTNSSVLFSSTMKKEAPMTPRGNNSNETLNDRPVPSPRPSHAHTRFCTCQVYLWTNSPCGDSGLQVSELVPRLGRIQPDRRQDAPSAGPQPDTGGDAVQKQHEHQPQETAGQTVQLVSTHRL